MTGTDTARRIITDPGLYLDLTADEYHADPVAQPGGSLSSSGARDLLPPSCPALYRWKQDNQHLQPPRHHYDLGHAAHRAVLGVGAGIHVVAADSWRTNAAKAERDEARAAGLTPLLEADAVVVIEMAAALRAHPTAAALLADGTGHPEATVVWQDEPTGVWCRAMIDWLPHHRPGRRAIVPDYKTCATAEPEALRRAFHQHGYHQQEDFYRAAVRSLGYPDPGFVFICQEKTAPYLVTVVELDVVAKRIGAARNHWARTTFRDCTESGHWPSYVEGIHLLSLPRWAEIEEGERVE